MTSRALTLTVTWLAARAGHHAGDYLVQRDQDARLKQQRTPIGRRALAAHCLSYGATQAATKWLAYRAAGIRVPARAWLAGQAAEVVLHAVIDDGRLLRRFSNMTGKRAFHDLAAGGVNGRALMDQALHHSVQQPIGAAITAVLTSQKRGSVMPS